MEIYKFVLTGGPCAGKTSSIKEIEKVFKKRGYQIIVVSETATDMMNAGLEPGGNLSAYQFQKWLLQEQLLKEDLRYGAAKCMQRNQIIMLYDRGALDGKAYLSDKEYARLLEELGLTEKELWHRYDAIFHLVTAAKGAEEFYTTENNEVRMETPEQAAALDDQVVGIWREHPHFIVIDNSGKTFQDKINRLICEMEKFLH